MNGGNIILLVLAVILTFLCPVTYAAPTDRINTANWANSEWEVSLGYDERVKNLDGVCHVNVIRFLEWYFDVSQNDTWVEWYDDTLGGWFYIEKTSGLLYGPETCVQLSGFDNARDGFWVPLRQLAENMYFTVTWKEKVKQVHVQRVQPAKVVIEKKAQIGTFYDKNGNKIKSFLVSTGKSYDWTPNGTWALKTLPLDKQNKYYFPSVPCYIKWCTQVRGNVCAHTTSFAVKNNLDSNGQRQGYAALGSQASNGCIRMLYSDARFLYCFASKFGSVEIIDGDKNEPLKQSLKVAKPPYETWISWMKTFE